MGWETDAAEGGIVRVVWAGGECRTMKRSLGSVNSCM